MIRTILVGYCQSINWIVRIVGKTIPLLMPCITFVIIFDVISRYFFNHPTIWAYDVSLFLFGYLAALGGAYAQQKRAHINVDILYLKVSPRTRQIFNTLTYLLATYFVVLLAYKGWDKFLEALQFNYRRQSEWAPHMHHFWLMITIAGSLMAIQLSADIIRSIYYVVTGSELIEE
ncbi:TRAP transporter small permease subunit [Celerinatantimonas sp. YJH-8]|uniref:TRAP transporter small permease subunit n=1 Tax=Celerinatantimonas sp. YJH-8 TaxID=3228714 RepID=UPI0038BE450D